MQTKSNPKTAQGLRPLGIPNFFVYLPFAAAGQVLPMVLTLRLPLPIVYSRVLTEVPAVAHRCIAGLLRSDSERSPLQALSL